MPGNEALATFLRERRDMCGLSIRQISVQLGQKGQPTHENAVSRWFTGQNRPGDERFDTLLEVLNVVRHDERVEAYRLRWPSVAVVLQSETSDEPSRDVEGVCDPELPVAPVE